MSSAQGVARSGLFTAHAPFRRSPAAALPVVRKVSTDASGPRRPRAVRQEQYAKRLEAVKAGRIVQLPSHQPIGPPIFHVRDILPKTAARQRHVKPAIPANSAKDRDIVALRHRTTTDRTPQRPASLPKEPTRIRHRHDESITSQGKKPSPAEFAETPSFSDIKRKWARSFQPDDSNSYLPRPLAEKHVTHTHHPQDKSAFYRAVSITRLDPDSTLTDLMQAIAAAGPFGMVTSASIDQVGLSRRTAEVVFNAEAAAQRFVAHAIAKGFRLGTAAPVVKLNSTKGFRDEPDDPIFSRVLRITGDPKVEGFDVDSLRRILAEKFRRPLDDPRWLTSEPPRTLRLRDGKKVIEWAFFSNEFQTKPFQMALRQHFGGKLFVGYGVDPCGNFKDLGKETQNRRAKVHYLAV